jgi:hypothetical protein
MKPKQAKLPKIKIPPQDLKSFLIDSLEVDPFWYDLYGIETEEVDEDEQ